MAIAALNDDKVETNDDSTYNNNVKDVPSYLLEPVIVVKDNIQKELVDTGYWTDAEVNG